MVEGQGGGIPTPLMGRYSVAPWLKCLIAAGFVSVILIILRTSASMNANFSPDQVLNFLGVIVAVWGVGIATYFGILAIDAFSHVREFNSIRDRMQTSAKNYEKQMSEIASIYNAKMDESIQRYEGHIKMADATTSRLSEFEEAYSFRGVTITAIISDLISDLSKRIDTDGKDEGGLSIDWGRYRERMLRLDYRQNFVLSKTLEQKLASVRPLIYLGGDKEIEIAAEFLSRNDINSLSRSLRHDADVLLEVALEKMAGLKLDALFRSSISETKKIEIAKEKILKGDGYGIGSVSKFLGTLDTEEARGLLAIADKRLQQQSRQIAK